MTGAQVCWQYPGFKLQYVMLKVAGEELLLAKLQNEVWYCQGFACAAGD